MSPDRAHALVRKRSLTIAGHRTSISLEDAFWTGLQSIADQNTCSLAALVADVDRGRGDANLSSAVRVFVLDRLMAGTGTASAAASADAAAQPGDDSPPC